MSQGYSGTLAVSVDLPSVSSSSGVRSLEATVSSLASLLQRHRVRATWGVDNIAGVRDLVKKLGGNQEIALLADGTWVGPDVSRRTLCRELDQKVNQAVAAQVEIATVLLRGTTLGEDTDVWVKHGIRAVRETAPAGGTVAGWLPLSVRQAPVTAPQQVRYGLWKVTAAVTVPRDGFGRVRRHLNAALAQGQSVQVALAADELARSGNRGLTQLQAVLRYVDRLRSQRRLDVTTLGELAGQLTCSRTHRPAQSILRRAA